MPFLAIILAALTVLCAVVAIPAADHPHPLGVETLATGLDNPRGLDFGPDGALYVAEAGRGGQGPCFQQPLSPPGVQACFGTTGAITKISRGSQVRVLTGLPSMARPNGSLADGPCDVSFQANGDMYFIVGVGIELPVVRNQLPVVGQEAVGWLLRARPKRKSWTWSQVADIHAYEMAHDPDGTGGHSNPNSLLATSGGFVVADAAGNSVLRISGKGDISALAAFPSLTVDAPSFLGLPPGTQVPADAVPTAVAQGPDGAFYIGLLTGFPFVPGAANVYRVLPHQAPTIYAEGFTNIIDLAWSDGSLYVLEIAHRGLASWDPVGALIRVERDGSQHIVMTDGLFLPAGLVIRHGSAFISNCSICAGAGEVLRVPLG